MEYARVMLGESFGINGYQLRPLQLGHVALLKALGCDEVKTPEQLAMAIMVCRTDWEESCRNIFGRRFLNYRLKRIAKKVMRYGWPSRLSLWLEYRKLNLESPPITLTSDKTGNHVSGTPFLQTLRVTLLRKCNYSPDTVMSTTYLQALWDYVSVWEQDGICEVHDRGLMDELKEFHERVKDDVEARHNNRMNTGGINGDSNGR